MTSESTTYANYELSSYNHLGNVRAVVSDVKVPTVTAGAITDLTADVVSATDYYPFGMQMPGRSFSSNAYRYGFQGQEKDDEIKGEGNSLNYKYRMHDPRIGRFFAVDPLSPKYPFYSPYQFSGNKTIWKVELEGLEEAKFNTTQYDSNIQNLNSRELKSYHDGQTLGLLNGVAAIAILFGGEALVPVVAEAYLTYGPAAALTGPELASFTANLFYEGADDPFPTSGAGGELGKIARSAFKNLIKSGKNIDEIATYSREFYKGLTADIPDFVRSLDIPLVEQARKAFDLRNNAKVLAREVSGPELKLKAEANSAGRYNGSVLGPSFDDLFNKHYDKLINKGLSKDEATSKAYNLIIDGTRKSNVDVDKATGVAK